MFQEPMPTFCKCHLSVAPILSLSFLKGWGPCKILFIWSFKTGKCAAVAHIGFLDNVIAQTTKVISEEQIENTNRCRKVAKPAQWLWEWVCLWHTRTDSCFSSETMGVSSQGGWPSHFWQEWHDRLNTSDAGAHVLGQGSLSSRNILTSPTIKIRSFKLLLPQFLITKALGCLCQYLSFPCMWQW